MKKKFVLNIFIIIFLIILFVIYKYIFAGTFFWKSYKNLTINLSFKYPSNWKICERTNGVVVVDNFSTNAMSRLKFDCNNFSSSFGERYIKIEKVDGISRSFDTVNYFNDYIIYQGDTYKLEYSPIVGSRTWPIKLILKTLKFQ